MMNSSEIMHTQLKKAIFWIEKITIWPNTTVIESKVAIF